jgi:tRNA isopentenyl-2-thiomethyl-A-37 hydroxylase MiaE
VSISHRWAAYFQPDRALGRVSRRLVAAFIEARSHEQQNLLAAGFTASGDRELGGSIYAALASAEERHAEIFLELAPPQPPPWSPPTR